MLIKSNQFPFKLMPKIIFLLDQSDKRAAFEISRHVGACLLDTRETISMLHYITNQGRVVRRQAAKDEWMLVNSSKPQQLDFRTKYVLGLLKLIDLLHQENEFLQTEELANRLNYAREEVSQALTFLETITDKGHLEYEGEGHTRHWFLKKWPRS